MATASATGGAPTVTVKESGAKGLSGTDGTDGAGFNQVRQSKLDNPLLHLFKTNQLQVVSAPLNIVADVTFTRASAANFVDRYGVVQTAAIDVPREEKGGFLIEGASTNEALHSRDLSNAAWTKTNITAVKDATGNDGAANAASSLTASAALGTVFQSITLGSQENTYSVDVKRKTGVGTIEMTDDGGTSFTDITSLINSTTYTRLTITTTQANPSIGFRITINTDAIEVDYNQLENLPFASSRIVTTTASVTRSRDIVSVVNENNTAVSIFTWSFTFEIIGVAVGDGTTEDQVFEIESADATLSDTMGLASPNLFPFKIDNNSNELSSNHTLNQPINVSIARVNSTTVRSVVDGVVFDDTIVENTAKGIATSGTISIGARNDGTAVAYIRIKDLRFYDFDFNADEATYLGS